MKLNSKFHDTRTFPVFTVSKCIESYLYDARYKVFARYIHHAITFDGGIKAYPGKCSTLSDNYPKFPFVRTPPRVHCLSLETFFEVIDEAFF